LLEELIELTELNEELLDLELKLEESELEESELESTTVIELSDEIEILEDELLLSLELDSNTGQIKLSP
jgi:hypothetical protein